MLLHSATSGQKYRTAALIQREQSSYFQYDDHNYKNQSMNESATHKKSTLQFIIYI